MQILTGEQMRRIDRRAIERFGISSLELMESAGRGVAQNLLRDYPERSLAVVVLCGRGNNGGDGLVAARHLAHRGVMPRVLLLGRADQLSGDAAHNLGAARAAGLEVQEIADSAAWSGARSAVAGSTLVLDAMLGTGVRGGARGLIAEVIEDLQRAQARVVSIDLPSGLDADSAEVPGAAVTAERTYTLVRPKLPLALDPAARYAGAWSVLPIGIPDEAVEQERADLEWLDATACRALLPRRAPDSHKGDLGHLLAVAGSRGKSGAAVLLARGALRSGVGLVTVAAPASVLQSIAVQQAEAMTEPLPEGESEELAGGAGGAVLSLLATRAALALGPGLGRSPDTVAAIRQIVAGCRAPAVVDADGLNALAISPTVWPIDSGCPLVLTPHPGEAARLLHRSSAEVQADRLAAVRELARASGATVALKGRRTLLATSDGRVAVNSSGNAGMATGGTGDVLTGAVGALLARGLSGWDAARLAVFVHGDAGDRAAREVGQDGMIASDVAARLPEALAALAEQRPAWGEIRRDPTRGCG